MTNAESDPSMAKLVETIAHAAAGKWIVAYGDAFNGIRLVGPFESDTDAVAYARRLFGDEMVWSARQLETPEFLNIEIGDSKP